MAANESGGRSVMVQGRIVWVNGDLFKGRPKLDMNTKQPVIDQKTGQQVIEYGFGLAVPKTLFTQENMAVGRPAEIWAAMYEEAFQLYPNRQLPPAFALKFKDGDGIDDKGVSFAQREGYAGHYVFALTTRLPIKFFRFENNSNIQVNEGIKCGDYVNVQVQIKAHGAVGTAKPGLYLNPMAVQFLGYGKEIINTPSGDQIFGVAAPAMPVGASATPIAPAGMLVPQGVPQAAPQPPAYQQPQAAPVAPVPHYGVVPTHLQPPQPVPMGPVQPIAPVMPPTVPGVPTQPAYAAPQAPMYQQPQAAPVGPAGFPMPGH